MLNTVYSPFSANEVKAAQFKKQKSGLFSSGKDLTLTIFVFCLDNRKICGYNIIIVAERLSRISSSDGSGKESGGLVRRRAEIMCEALCRSGVMSCGCAR